MGKKNDVPQEKRQEILIESSIRNLSLSEEATMIIDTYLESQLLSATEIATMIPVTRPKKLRHILSTYYGLKHEAFKKKFKSFKFKRDSN